VVRENLPTRLVAYVSPTQGARPPSTAMIRRSLRTRLPEYMVPSDILQLTALPRTERGKVDRRALPEVPAHVANVEEMDQQELAMSTLWQQVLELPELNLDDDFMALGGDSLSAEELLTLVADHFGVEIASTDLLAYPTLREFTQHVTAGRTALPTHPDVVTLNGSATGTPVFCFPGAGALALTYLPLAKHFPEQTFYAFQQHGLEKRGLPDWSIEAMVSRALQLVRIVRPHGPYRLIGHSFGGLVAVETARQLVDAGEEVESLVILDTYLPEERAAEAVAETAAPAGAAAPAPGGFARAQGLASGILQRFAPDGLPRGENVGRQVRAYLAGVVRHRGQRQYDSFFDQAVLLARKYRLRPSATPTVLVVADDNPGGAAAWSRVLSNLEVVTMAAEHTSILREPHVRELAERLAPALADRAPATTVATP
jgi:thioesterase domain-containing protein/acyl carrier protein